jgi:cytidylate kinase
VSPSPVITVDGPAAAGKGTLARRLAAHFGFAHLDSGKLYRAVALRLLRAGGDPDDADAALAAAEAAPFTVAELADPELLDDPAAAAASKVAAYPAVRTALLAFQRGFAAAPPDGAPGAVIDGRDIGTVVCPDAPAKLFVTASAEARAERRHKELLARGVESIYPRILRDMKERDARDSQRAVAPLRPAEDAFLLDTTELDADAAFAAALHYIRTRPGF